MKKFFAIIIAALMSVSVLASKDVVPADTTLSNYYRAGQVCVCIYVPGDMACYEIVLTGSFNGWTTTLADCPKFEALKNYDGWYVAAFDPEAEPDEERGVQAKPIMLDGDGNFNWSYQVGAATVIRGGVQVISGYEGEIDLINYGTDAPNVFTVDEWKQNPCTAIYHNYTITVISDGCNGNALPFLVGSMNNWSFEPMQKDDDKTEENNAPTYTASFKAAEGAGYQIVSGLVDETGETVEPGWTDESYMQKLVNNEWVRIPGEDGANLITHEDANILFDLRSDTLRWARCADSQEEEVVLWTGNVLVGMGSETGQDCEADIFQTSDYDKDMFAGIQVGDLIMIETENAENSRYALYYWSMSNSEWVQFTTTDAVYKDSSYIYIKVVTEDVAQGIAENGIAVAGTCFNIVGIYAMCAQCKGSSEPGSGKVKIDGIFYNLDSYSNTAEVTYEGDDEYNSNPERYVGDVVIPESILYDNQTYTVTSIGSYSFRDCPNLTTINIPNTVTSIGFNAFQGCSSLSAISIPDSVTYIGWGAFSACSSLTSLFLPKAVSHIEGYTLAGCPSLQSIVVEEGNETYDSRNNCNAVIETATNKLVAGCNKSVIPEGVVIIGYEAFSQRSGLQSINIPNTVTTIEEYAFPGCDSVINISIPNSVTSIGQSALSCCNPLLESIVVAEGNPIYDSRNNCNALIETATNVLILGCKNSVIPDGIDSIGDYAFKECSNLATIVIPNSVTKIGSGVFQHCSNLHSINIPSEVSYIGDFAFSSCYNLISVTCEASTPPSMGEDVFYDAYNVSSQGTLYVPAESVELYKKAAVWSNFAHIKAIGSTRYYLVGSGEALGSWGLDNALPMEGDSITLHLASNAYEFKVLPQTDSWDNAMGYEYVSAECSSEGLTEGANGNVKFTLAQEGDVHVAVVNGQLCVNGVFGGEIAITSYTVIGDAVLFGAEWDIYNTSADMTQQKDGSWVYVIPSDTLYAGTYMYKFVANHTWSVMQYPDDERYYTFEIGTDGVYSITFTLIPGEGGTATVTMIEELNPDPTVPTDTIPEESVVTIMGLEIDPSQIDTAGVVDIYGDSTLVYDPEENTLTLNNLTLEVGEEESTAISYTGTEPLTIVLNDSSTIMADTIISSTADVIITGEGTLIAEGTVPIIGVPEAKITFDSVNMHVQSLPSAAAVRRRIRGGKRLDETGGPALSGFGSADFDKVDVTPSDAEYGEVEVSSSSSSSGSSEAVFALFVVNGAGEKEVLTEFTLTARADALSAVEQTRTPQPLDPTQPMYNILGMQVGADYKGIVIQNGNTYLR